MAADEGYLSEQSSRRALERSAQALRDDLFSFGGAEEDEKKVADALGAFLSNAEASTIPDLLGDGSFGTMRHTVRGIINSLEDLAKTCGSISWGDARNTMCSNHLPRLKALLA